MEESRIEKLLPSVMQRTLREDSVLQTMMSIMAGLHSPTEKLLSELDLRFNPSSTPEELLPMLAHWMNLLRLFQPENNSDQTNPWGNRTIPTQAKHLRALIENATRISQWRGTQFGMLQMLEIATGVKGFEIDDGTKGQGSSHNEPFHIDVTVPYEAEPYKELIERIVIQEKPAYTTVSIKQCSAPEPIAVEETNTETELAVGDNGSGTP